MVLYGNCARLNHLHSLLNGTIKELNLGKAHQNFIPFPCLNYLNFVLPFFVWSFPFLSNFGAFFFMWLNPTFNYPNKTIFDISTLRYYSELTTVKTHSVSDWCSILTDPLRKRKTIVMKYPNLKINKFCTVTSSVQDVSNFVDTRLNSKIETSVVYGDITWLVNVLQTSHLSFNLLLFADKQTKLFCLTFTIYLPVKINGEWKNCKILIEVARLIS